MANEKSARVHTIDVSGRRREKGRARKTRETAREPLLSQKEPVRNYEIALVELSTGRQNNVGRISSFPLRLVRSRSMETMDRISSCTTPFHDWTTFTTEKEASRCTTRSERDEPCESYPGILLEGSVGPGDLQTKTPECSENARKAKCNASDTFFSVTCKRHVPEDTTNRTIYVNKPVFKMEACFFRLYSSWATGGHDPSICDCFEHVKHWKWRRANESRRRSQTPEFY